jgi:hypothetical protein
VNRVWREYKLKPHQVKGFKVSPRFAEKLIDVIGLYLDLPEKAIVFSVDELGGTLFGILPWNRSFKGGGIVEELKTAIRNYLEQRNANPKVD